MSAPSLTRSRVILATCLVAGLALLACVSLAGLLMLSPAIALVVLIGLGLFPSEELIARLRRRLRRPRRVADVPARRPAMPAVPRLGAVLPFALAVRPPPRQRLLPIA